MLLIPYSLTQVSGATVNFNSATTDGADVAAAQISVIVALSSTTTDGADILAGSVSPVVALSLVTTDGSDALSSSISPVISITSSKTDGADTLAAIVSPLIDLASITKHGGDDVPRREYWETRKTVKHDEVLDKLIRDAYTKATGQVKLVAQSVEVEDEDDEILMMLL